MTSEASKLKTSTSIGKSQKTSRSSKVSKENEKSRSSKRQATKSTTPAQKVGGGDTGEVSKTNVRCRQTKAQLLDQLSDLREKLQSEKALRLELQKKHNALRDNITHVYQGAVTEVQNKNKTIKELRERLSHSALATSVSHAQEGDISIETGRSQIQPKNCSTPNVQKCDNSTSMDSNLSHESTTNCLQTSDEMSVSFPRDTQSLKPSTEGSSSAGKQSFDEHRDGLACIMAHKEIQTSDDHCRRCKIQQYTSSDKQTQTVYGITTSSPAKGRSLVNADETQISVLCPELLETSSESSGFKRLMAAVLQECNNPEEIQTQSVGPDFSMLSQMCNSCQQILLRLRSPRVSSDVKVPPADDNRNFLVSKIKLCTRENSGSVTGDTVNTSVVGLHENVSNVPNSVAISTGTAVNSALLSFPTCSNSIQGSYESKLTTSCQFSGDICADNNVPNNKSTEPGPSQLCDDQQMMLNDISNFMSPNKFQYFNAGTDGNTADDISLSYLQCSMQGAADLQLSQYLLENSLNTCNTSIFHRSPILDRSRLHGVGVGGSPGLFRVTHISNSAEVQKSPFKKSLQSVLAQIHRTSCSPVKCKSTVQSPDVPSVDMANLEKSAEQRNYIFSPGILSAASEDRLVIDSPKTDVSTCNISSPCPVIQQPAKSRVDVNSPILSENVKDFQTFEDAIFGAVREESNRSENSWSVPVCDIKVSSHQTTLPKNFIPVNSTNVIETKVMGLKGDGLCNKETSVISSSSRDVSTLSLCGVKCAQEICDEHVDRCAKEPVPAVHSDMSSECQKQYSNNSYVCPEIRKCESSCSSEPNDSRTTSSCEPRRVKLITLLNGKDLEKIKKCATNQQVEAEKCSVNDTNSVTIEHNIEMESSSRPVEGSNNAILGENKIYEVTAEIADNMAESSKVNSSEINHNSVGPESDIRNNDTDSDVNKKCKHQTVTMGKEFGSVDDLKSVNNARDNMNAAQDISSSKTLEADVMYDTNNQMDENVTDSIRSGLLGKRKRPIDSEPKCKRSRMSTISPSERYNSQRVEASEDWPYSSNYSTTRRETSSDSERHQLRQQNQVPEQNKNNVNYQYDKSNRKQARRRRRSRSDSRRRDHSGRSSERNSSREQRCNYSDRKSDNYDYSGVDRTGKWRSERKSERNLQANVDFKKSMRSGIEGPSKLNRNSSGFCNAVGRKVDSRRFRDCSTGGMRTNQIGTMRTYRIGRMMTNQNDSRRASGRQSPALFSTEEQKELLNSRRSNSGRSETSFQNEHVGCTLSTVSLKQVSNVDKVTASDETTICRSDVDLSVQKQINVKVQNVPNEALQTPALDQDAKLIIGYINLSKLREKSQLIQNRCNEQNLRQTLAAMEKSGRFIRLTESGTDGVSNCDVVTGNITVADRMAEDVTDENCLSTSKNPIPASSFRTANRARRTSDSEQQAKPTAVMTVFTTRRLAQLEALKLMKKSNKV